MKIVHVIEGLELSSGVSLFCVEMCNRQSSAGHEVVLLYRYRYEYKPSDAVRVIKCNVLEGLEKRPDIVHIHGLWSPFILRALGWCCREGVPYVISPHGCLMPWAMRNGRWKKCIFFHLFLKTLMRKATCLHVTTNEEKDACKKLGLNCEYVVVPLGVSLPDVDVSISSGSRARTVLFLSRVSREKGVEILLDAWKQLSLKDWNLVIAGPSWRGYSEKLMRKVREESIGGVKFIGSVLGDVKDNVYRNADLFILPSYAENFGSVVAEALSYGLPVIATRGTPWSILEEAKAGWWVKNDLKSLVGALTEAMQLGDHERKEMGARGRKLVARKYIWSSLVGEMLNSYKKALH